MSHQTDFTIVTDGGSLRVSAAMMHAVLTGDEMHKRVVHAADGTAMPMLMHKMCASCQAGYGINPPFPESGMLCGGCKNVHYCDRKCQRAHWKEHKPKCKEMEAARLEYKEAERQWKGKQK